MRLPSASIVLLSIVLGLFVRPGCVDQGIEPPSPRPFILNLLPESLQVGGVLEISGRGFGQFSVGAGVEFSGNIMGEAYPEWSETRIKVVVPTGTTSGPVRVLNASGLSNAVHLTVIPQTGSIPIITEVRPNPADIGERLRIHGSNFGPESPIVTISGVQAILDEWREDEIRAYVASGSVTGSLVVICGSRSSVPYLITITGTTGALTVTPSPIAVQTGSVANATISGGVPPYTVQTPPNNSIATASITGSVLSVTGVSSGSTSLLVRESGTPSTINVNITVSPSGTMVSFAQQIQPLFNAQCSGCHGSSGGLSLTTGQSYSNLVNVQAQAGCTTEKRVLPSNASASVLYKRVSGNSCGSQMPKGGTPLSAADIQKIADWINQGALNN